MSIIQSGFNGNLGPGVYSPLSRFVDLQFGDDINGDGTARNPYLTLQKAYNSITDASGSKQYMIYVLSAGLYGSSGSTLIGKANVGIMGCGELMLEINNPLQINSVVGDSEFTEFINIEFETGVGYNGASAALTNLMFSHAGAVNLNYKSSPFGVYNQRGGLLIGASIGCDFVTMKGVDLYGTISFSKGTVANLLGCNFQGASLALNGNCVVTMLGGNNPTNASGSTLSGVPFLTYDRGTKPANFTGTLGQTYIDGNFTFTDGHLKSKQTTSVSLSINSNLGTGATGSLSRATDMAGNLSLTTGSLSLSSGIEASIIFAQAYNVAPIVMITPTNSSAAIFTGGAFVGSSTSGFNLNFAVAGAALTTYQWNYFVIETQ